MVALPQDSMRYRLVALGMSLALLMLLGQWRHASDLTVLQMNLCNSGWAGCYTGRSLAEAASVIARSRSGRGHAQRDLPR